MTAKKRRNVPAKSRDTLSQCIKAFSTLRREYERLIGDLLRDELTTEVLEQNFRRLNERLRALPEPHRKQALEIVVDKIIREYPRSRDVWHGNLRQVREVMVTNWLGFIDRANGVTFARLLEYGNEALRLQEEQLQDQGSKSGRSVMRTFRGAMQAAFGAGLVVSDALVIIKAGWATSHSTFTSIPGGGVIFFQGLDIALRRDSGS